MKHNENQRKPTKLNVKYITDSNVIIIKSMRYLSCDRGSHKTEKVREEVSSARTQEKVGLFHISESYAKGMPRARIGEADRACLL